MDSVMTMQELLFSAVEQRILRHLDMQFAMVVAKNDEPAVMLAAAILSRDTGDGHVCLPLANLVTDNKTPAILQACFALVGKVNWLQVLLCSPSVSKGDTATPLILQGERLYLNRMWHNELTIAHFFNKANQSLHYDKNLLISTLNKLFGRANSKLVNWQKVAATVALTRRISVILGGPGTGKTTTVAKLLTAIIHMAGKQKCRIKLAAPTGKAAMRLTKSLSEALQYRYFTEAQHNCLLSQASTLHHLLGAHPNSHHLIYHAGNMLHLDVLVVDEASMINLVMMSSLINALPPHAKVIFLGDHDQLASVEAGAVLGDICTYVKSGYTTSRAHELTQLTGYQINGNPNPIAGVLRDSLCLLQKSYRFCNNSGIGQLATAVNRGNLRAIKTIFSNTYNDIKKTVLKTTDDYLQMLKEVLEGYFCFLRSVHQQSDPEKVIATFNQFQLLCALRNGPFGVDGLNKSIEQMLFKTRHINHQPYSQWYEGRPVMILRNHHTLKLFNGDIGVALDRGQKGLRIWFQMPDGSVKSVQPSRLPEHETAWAITVHKSQGSEFDSAALILPMQTTPVVTRELVYTAVTRARKHLALYADDRILTQAILTRTERRSGLKVMFEST